MIEGISEIILQKIKAQAAGGVQRIKKVFSSGVEQTGEIDPNAGVHSEFDLESLNLKGMTQEEEDHVKYLINKLIKEVEIEEPEKGTEQRKRTLPLEIEKQLHKYLTKKEKEMVGILINKLI